MSQTLNNDLLMMMLGRLPGAAFCSTMDPVTQASRWLFLDPRIAALYDLDASISQQEPWVLMQGIHPEDRDSCTEMVTRCMTTRTPMAWEGRVKRRDGSIRWVEVSANVEAGSEGAILWFGQITEITARKQLEESAAATEQELRARNEQLAQSEDDNAKLIERMRYAIDELSNPILEVWDDVLVMPIIGLVDSRRTAEMVQRLLAEVTRSQASFVIIDLTGVEIVDTKTADHLMKLMRKVEIVGAACVLTGIRPAVAETLVDIGVDFGRITTLRNLKHGLREALRRQKGQRAASSDLLEDEPESSARANGRRAPASS